MFTSLEFLAQNRSHISVPVTPVTTMESSHCREIHYHLARALMHLNCIAGFLPFLNQQRTGRIMRQTFTVAPASAIAIFIHLYHFLPLRLFLHLHHTEEFLPIWSSILNPIFVLYPFAEDLTLLKRPAQPVHQMPLRLVRNHPILPAYQPNLVSAHHTG